MINYAYNQLNDYQQTPLTIGACFIIFADLTAFFFLAFMNICFDTIVDHPPMWLMATLYTIMIADIIFDVCSHYRLYRTWKKRRTQILPSAISQLNQKQQIRIVKISTIFNTIVVVILILSWQTQSVVILYLSSLVFIRLPQIFKFNEILKYKLRPCNQPIQKLYLFLKIIYLFVLLAHVLGCIFYAIDNALVKMQYFGTIQQNPGLYYQGMLLCYSPIYSLSEIDRYIYAMYYIISLLATVAYGDIIPKNPFENAYVCFLLVFSTCSISFIIEQLMIMIRNQWNHLIYTIRKVKFLDSKLSSSINLRPEYREDLITYLISFHYPDVKRLTKKLEQRLVGEAIGIKIKERSRAADGCLIAEDQQERNTYYDKQQQGKAHLNHLNQKNKKFNYPIRNLQAINNNLPTLLTQFLLTKLQFAYYPPNYVLVDNGFNGNKYNNNEEQNSLYIMIDGKIDIGYGSEYHMLKQLVVSSSNRQRSNTLLCWRQFLWQDPSLHPYLKIRTTQLCQFFTLSSQKLKDIIKHERDRRLNDEDYTDMLESYHYDRDEELIRIYEDGIEVEKQKQPDQKAELLNTFYNEDIHSNSIQRTLPCWLCNKYTHLPYNCPKLHYRPTVTSIYRAINKATRHQTKQYEQYEIDNGENLLFIRKRMKYWLYEKMYNRRDRTHVRASICSKNTKSGKVPRFQPIKTPSLSLKPYIQKITQRVANLRNMYESKMPIIFEVHYNYEHYYTEYNIKNYMYGLEGGTDKTGEEINKSIKSNRQNEIGIIKKLNKLKPNRFLKKSLLQEQDQPQGFQLIQTNR